MANLAGRSEGQAAASAEAGCGLVVSIPHQLLDRDRLLGHLGLVEDEIADLVLEQRCAQLLQRTVVVLEELDHLALLAGIAHRLAHHRLLQLLALDLDLVLRADVGEQQTQAHATLGDRAVLGLELVLALARPPGWRAGALGLVGQLLPDGVELEVDHALRHPERIVFGQAIEQRPLELGPAEAPILVGEPLLERVLQLGQILEAQLLGPVVVDGQRDGRLDLVDRDREDGVLAGDLRPAVAVREGHLDLAGLAGQRAHELLLEARHHALEPSRSGKPLPAPPSNGVPSILPSKSIRSWSPSGRGPRLGRRLELLARLGEVLDRLLDLVGRRLGHQPGQADRRQLDLRHLRQHLDLHVELEILALVERGDLDLRAQGRTKLVLADGLLGTLVDRLFKDLAQDRAAVLLLEQGQRRLAGSEPGQPHGLRQLLEPGPHPLLDLASGDGDLELPLSPSATTCSTCIALASIATLPALGSAADSCPSIWCWLGAGGETRTRTARATGT